MSSQAGKHPTAPPAAGPLRPGRHGLSPQLVASHQRRRLIQAAIDELLERGYAGATTTRIAAAAHVSTATYYQNFADLWDCFAGAYEMAAGRLLESMAATQADWAAQVRATVDAVLGFLAAEPGLALLLTAEPPPEATALTAARSRLIERLSALLRRGREQVPEVALPAHLEERLVEGAVALVAGHIVSGNAARLPALAPELTELLLAPYGAASPTR